MKREQGGTYNPNWKKGNTCCQKCGRYTMAELFNARGCIDCGMTLSSPCVYAGSKDAVICSTCNGIEKVCSHQSKPKEKVMSLEKMLNEAMAVIKTSVDVEVVEAGETVQNYIDAFTGQLLSDQAECDKLKARVKVLERALDGLASAVSHQPKLIVKSYILLAENELKIITEAEK